MKKLQQLKEERASLKDKQQQIVDVARAESREFTEAENTEFDGYQERIAALKTQIERAEIIEQNEKEAVRAGAGESVGAPATPKKEERTFSLVGALRSLANNEGLSGVAKEVHEEAVREMRSQGLSVPEGNVISLSSSQMRGQSVTGDSGTKGGKLVASTPSLVQPLQPIVSIEDLGVNVMSGLVGDVPLPTSNSFNFNYLGETEEVAESDITFSGPVLKPKRCAGSVLISRKLLAQSSFDIEAWLIRQINIEYGNAIVRNAINGAGGNAPTGLYDLVQTNIDTTAGAPSYDVAVALEGLIDAADATSVNRAYLSDTKLRAKMKSTKIDAGSGRFLTDGTELNGYKYMANNLVPALDSGASHPLIFGDWSQLTVGYWGSLTIMVDPYTKAGSSQVKLIIEGFSDVALANEKAFAINKVLTA